MAGNIPISPEFSFFPFIHPFISFSSLYTYHIILIERGLYCNHLVRPSICPSVHTFVTDISASTGRNDCTSTSCLPCDLQMNEWGYS
jgi:hypothetical protein